MALLLLLQLFLVPFAPENPTSAIVLELEAEPVQLTPGQPVSLTFIVRNSSEIGLYFKRPWKWATNGMYLEAVSEAGKVHTSPVLLFDIDVDFRCTYFTALHPGDELRFRETLNWALPAGRYDLTWKYDPVHYPDEGTCLVTDWPLWRGVASSKPVRIEVR